MYLIPACAICEDMLISIHDERGVKRSSASDDFDDKLDVVSAHSGRPTTRDILNSFDDCRIDGPMASTNEGMTILALNGTKLLVLYYTDDQMSVRVYDPE